MSEFFQIFVWNPGKKTIAIDVNNETIMSEIVNIVEKKMKVPKKFFYITYGLKNLSNSDYIDETISSLNTKCALNISKDSFLEFHIRSVALYNG